MRGPLGLASLVVVFGTMHATVVAVADEIASTAELASGKTSGRPLVLVRGATLPAGDGSVVADVVMSPAADMFP